MAERIADPVNRLTRATRGDATAESDLDILVEYNRPPSLFQFVRLQRDLSELLGVPVDLVMKSALRPAIGQVILSEVVAV